jgi:hypothetical protein
MTRKATEQGMRVNQRDAGWLVQSCSEPSGVCNDCELIDW